MHLSEDFLFHNCEDSLRCFLTKSSSGLLVLEVKSVVCTCLKPLCFHSWSNHLIVDLIRPALCECVFFKDHKLCHHAPSGLLVLLRSSVHLFFYRMHRMVKFCLSERFIWAFEPLLVFISSFIYTDIFLGCCIHSRYYVSFIYHDNETGLSWPWNCLSVHRLVIFSLWTSGTVYKVVIITTQLMQYLTPWIKQKVCTWITFRLFDFNCGSVQNYKNWFTI